MSAAREYVFDDLLNNGWETVGPSTSVRLYEDQHKVPHVQRLPLREFLSDDRVFVSDKPVELTITSEENQYFASSESLKIFAVGDSIPSAIEDFSHHIAYFFDYYSMKETHEVGGNAARLKELYETHFVLV